MANPLVTGPGAVRKVIPKVYVKNNWDDPWLFIEGLRALRSIRTVSPSTSQADFVWHFGRLRNKGNPPELRDPLKLIDYYVKITGLHASGEEELLWVGIMVDDERQFDYHGRGIQNYKAFGLEHVLDRIPINKAYVSTNRGVGGEIEWAPSFNELTTGRQRSLDVTTRRIKGNRHDLDNLFGESGELWNLRQACTYVLDQFGTFSTVTFNLAGQIDALEQFDRGIWEQEGKTVKGFLDTYVSRNVGMGWLIALRDSGIVPIEIFTITDQPITVGPITLPANDSTAPFFMPRVHPFGHVWNIGVLRYANSEVVDSITVQGERVKYTNTWSYTDQNLEKGWTDALFNEYNQLPVGGNLAIKEMERSTDKYSNVFALHKVPSGANGWDGTVGDGIGGLLLQRIPVADDDGVVLLLPIIGGADNRDFTLFDKRFEGMLPFLDGWDYSQNPPVDNNAQGVDSSFRAILGIMKDPRDNTYVVIDRMDHKAPGRLHACSILPYDRAFGVRIHSSPRHHIGRGVFTGKSTFRPEIDYRTLILTATHKADCRQHIKASNPTRHSTTRELVITVPDAEYWIVAPNTVLDVDAQGALLRIHPNNLTVRDDLAKLQAVSAFARAYYFQQRQAIGITVPYVSASPATCAELGSFITDLVGLNVREPVKACVTSQELDYEQQTTVFKTSYMNIDDLVKAGVLFAEQITTHVEGPG